MPWMLPVVLRTLIGNVLGSILIKTASAAPARTERFALQYFFASALILVSFAAAGFAPDQFFLYSIVIGCANGLGAYCQWRAIDLSLARASLFSWGSAFIAILLGYAFLDERAMVNPALAVGLVLTFLSAIALAIREHRVKKESGVRSGGLGVYGWIAAYTIIWGCIGFLQRVFAIEGVRTATFLGGWYLGSFLVGAILAAGAWRQGKLAFTSFTTKDVMLSAALALVIVGNLGLEYWTYHYLPLAVAQSLFLFLGTVIPAFIGLFYFKEAREFDRRTWGLYGLGILGALLVIGGFVMF